MAASPSGRGAVVEPADESEDAWVLFQEIVEEIQSELGGDPGFEVRPHPQHMRDLPGRRGRPVYDQVMSMGLLDELHDDVNDPSLLDLAFRSIYSPILTSGRGGSGYNYASRENGGALQSALAGRHQHDRADPLATRLDHILAAAADLHGSIGVALRHVT
ncbi:hypothetical protein JQ615_33705 [Bradyrhizobium jicamae]|uniref:Uncharacterized protein n=1 Tax=Bradyrhizobium jicamae TaxID=280332 RepID=A0ABS5FUC5_9BRAD|nr:hypothetical protein [Bradyrhizobium jicamae]MBR0800336.1 hypothetical protein [Bradyrhizobium jicamae]